MNYNPNSYLVLKDIVGSIMYEKRKCNSISTDNFFPKKDIDVSPKNGVENLQPNQNFKNELKNAKNICLDCIIKEQCLIVAGENNEHDGVFGGEYFGGLNGYEIRKKINNVKEN